VVAEARARWPEFNAAFDRRAAEDAFLVKAKFSDEKVSEWMWLTVEGMDSEVIRGKLANKPVDVKSVSEGDEVEVLASRISDGYYASATEEVGQFSLKLLK
jgi:uncharacterized protein YegJ (DUF2314 family)